MLPFILFAFLVSANAQAQPLIIPGGGVIVPAPSKPSSNRGSMEVMREAGRLVPFSDYSMQPSQKAAPSASTERPAYSVRGSIYERCQPPVNQTFDIQVKIDEPIIDFSESIRYLSSKGSYEWLKEHRNGLMTFGMYSPKLKASFENIGGTIYRQGEQYCFSAHRPTIILSLRSTIHIARELATDAPCLKEHTIQHEMEHHRITTEGMRRITKIIENQANRWVWYTTSENEARRLKTISDEILKEAFSVQDDIRKQNEDFDRHEYFKRTACEQDEMQKISATHILKQNIR